MKRILLLLLLIFCMVQTVHPADQSFLKMHKVQSFIKKMVIKHHYSKKKLIFIFSHIKRRPEVIQNVKVPTEALPWYKYQSFFITDSRIKQGVIFWKRHAITLRKAEKIYGVPASIIVATLGVETKYGQNTGQYPVIDALTNIAFSDSKRAPYFLSELEEFLLLTHEKHLNPLSVKGSYAGAIGQPQFMPSSYRYYAVNFSGRSRIDLTNDTADIIASIANYYQKHGWLTHQPVVMPADIRNTEFNQTSLVQMPKIVSIPNKFSRYGKFPLSSTTHQKPKLLALQNQYGNEYWLSFHNFDVIKRYNASDLYAMAVYQLSYFISAEKKHRTL